MTTVDIILLQILVKKANESLNIREIYHHLGNIEISSCASSIYRRLHNLKDKSLIRIHWETGSKFYSISETGKEYLNKFKKQLQI